MATLTIRWITVGDDNVCPICKQLETTPWLFGPGHDLGNELVRAPWGIVWDTARGSTAHEHGTKGKCRCHIEAEWDLSDVNALLRNIRDSLRNAVDRGTSQGNTFSEGE